MKPPKVKSKLQERAVCLFGRRIRIPKSKVGQLFSFLSVFLARHAVTEDTTLLDRE